MVVEDIFAENIIDKKDSADKQFITTPAKFLVSLLGTYDPNDFMFL